LNFEITEIVKRKKKSHSKVQKRTRNSEIEKKNENPKTGRLAQSMKSKNVNAP